MKQKMYKIKELEIKKEYKIMSELKYEEKTVKVLDALVKDEDISNNAEQETFVQTLHLLLQEVTTKKVFETILFESDIRKIIGRKDPLNSKQIIDLSIALRNREEPLKLIVPAEAVELNVNDIINSRKLDPPKPKNNRKRNRYRNNKPKQNV